MPTGKPSGVNPAGTDAAGHQVAVIAQVERTNDVVMHRAVDLRGQWMVASNGGTAHRADDELVALREPAQAFEQIGMRRHGAARSAVTRTGPISPMARF
jgi:hypothetical protein